MASSAVHYGRFRSALLLDPAAAAAAAQQNGWPESVGAAIGRRIVRAQVCQFAFSPVISLAIPRLPPPLQFANLFLLFVALIAASGQQAASGLKRQQNLLEASSLFAAQALVSSSSSSASTSGEKPKLIPLVAADSGYSENSSVNILCTVSQGHHETLTFDWFKDGQLLQQEQPLALQLQLQANNNNNNKIDKFGFPSLAPNLAPQIEKHLDHSLLRISRVQLQHSGRYTCEARNQFGQDSSSVNLIVNVKLQWTNEPPKEVVVSVNQELKVDCLAHGEPRPSMRWERLSAAESPSSASLFSFPARRGTGSQQSSAGNGNMGANGKNQLAATASSNGYKLAAQQQPNSANGQLAFAHGQAHQNGLLVSSNRYLSIQRTKESDAGIYECIASNSHDADLRKLVHVQVRGK